MPIIVYIRRLNDRGRTRLDGHYLERPEVFEINPDSNRGLQVTSFTSDAYRLLGQHLKAYPLFTM